MKYRVITSYLLLTPHQIVRPSSQQTMGVCSCTVIRDEKEPSLPRFGSVQVLGTASKVKVD